MVDITKFYEIALTCFLCYKKCPNYEGLMNHKLIYHTCNICNILIRDPTNHKLRIHTSHFDYLSDPGLSWKYYCPENGCNYINYNEFLILSHQMYTHRKKVLACPGCHDGHCSFKANFFKDIENH